MKNRHSNESESEADNVPRFVTVTVNGYALLDGTCVNDFHLIDAT